MNDISLKEKIQNRQNGLLFYGLTPPKFDTDSERLQEIAVKQLARLEGLPIDGLVVYDIQDESSRTNMPRPFPFIQTLAPDTYVKGYLKGLKVPTVIYKSVGKFTKESIKNWLTAETNNIDVAVFVGAPSVAQKVNLSLQEAYAIKQKTTSTMLLGGVTIPERHFNKGDEHLRLINKTKNGCSFFITQCVYNLDNAKDLLSDYYFYCIENNLTPVPIIFTLTPIGSLKTLEFTRWLGIDIQRWLENELKISDDILRTSINICRYIANDLIAFAAEKNIPIGFNIESVAIRKAEIDAAITLVNDVRKMLNN